MYFHKSKKFNKLLEVHWDDLYQVCFAWTHDGPLSSDLVQMTIESALRNEHKINSANHLKKWLFTVLANHWRDHLRSTKHAISSDDLHLADTNTPDMEHDYTEAVQQLYRAMNQLTLEQREVIALVSLQGFSYEQVSAILEVPIGTIMSRLNRARKALRNQIYSNTTAQGPRTSIRTIK